MLVSSFLPLFTTGGNAVISPMPDQPAGQVNRVRRRLTKGKRVDWGDKKSEEEERGEQTRQPQFHNKPQNQYS
jgi:hypothetical protein